MWLAERIKQGEAFSAGKLGTSELEIFIWFLHESADAIMPSKRQLQNFLVNAGFWVPAGKSAKLFFEVWARKIIQALEEMDAVVNWNGDFEKSLLDIYAPSAKLLALRDLEPYYHPLEQRWTLALPDNSVLAVVSPFVASISQQLDKLDKIWPAADVWKSGQKFVPVKTFYGPHLDEGGAGWPTDIIEKGPFEAVKRIVGEVVKAGATHAMVGCGALSLLICNELKRKGITAIHTGGATQIFFGVYGERWIKHDIISKFINDSWIRPIEEEVPSGAKLVERGCYW